MSAVRRSVGFVVSISLLAYVAWAFDLRSGLASIARLDAARILVVVVLLAGNMIFSAMRFRSILAGAGIGLSAREALRINTISQLGGLFLFQIVGQIVGRAAMLARHGVPAATAAGLTVYEKVASLAVSLAFLVGGLAYLYGDAAWPLVTEALASFRLPQFLALTVIAALLSWRFGALRIERRLIPAGEWPAFLASAGAAIALTLAAQGCLVAAYVVVCDGLVPGQAMRAMAAAASVIMYVAALPLSAGGWGLREIASVKVLGQIGVDPTSALAVSLFIGSAALVVLLIGSGIAAGLGKGPAVVGDHTSRENLARRRDSERAAGLSIVLAAAILVAFQVHLSVSGSLLSINPADPFVLAAAAACAWRLISTRTMPRWLAPRFSLFLILATATICLAFVVGWVHFGTIPWAVNNRLVGWLVILGYLFAGAFVVHIAGANGRRRLLETIVCAGLVVALYLIVSVIAEVAAKGSTLGTIFPSFAGLSPNRNAVAFQLLCALTAVCCTREWNNASWRRRIFPVAAVALGVAIALTNSRTAIGATVVVMVVACLLEVRRKTIPIAAVVGLLAVVGFQGAAAKFNLYEQSIDYRVSYAESDDLRRTTIIGGLDLWMKHPVLGAGLGAYIAGQAANGAEPFVIHSTPVWIVAELGPLGVLVFGGAFVLLVGWGIANRATIGKSQSARGVALLLIAFGAMSLLHDILYQRMVWLMLGAYLADRPAAPSA